MSEAIREQLMSVAILIYMKIQKTSLMAKNDFWCCLGAVCIMDHAVVSCSSKLCDWPLNLSQDHLSLHQQKNVRVTMDLRSPKGLFSDLHHPLTWSNRFCSERGKNGSHTANIRGPSSNDMVQWVLQWERQKWFSHCKCQGTMAEKCQFLWNFILLFIF